jgi:hypothetical protein
VIVTRTTIEFVRGIGTDEHGDRITETINAEVTADGESATIDLPTGSPWECDLGDLRSALT